MSSGPSYQTIKHENTQRKVDALCIHIASLCRTKFRHQPWFSDTTLLMMALIIAAAALILPLAQDGSFTLLILFLKVIPFIGLLCVRLIPLCALLDSFQCSEDVVCLLLGLQLILRMPIESRDLFVLYAALSRPLFSAQLMFTFILLCGFRISLAVFLVFICMVLSSVANQLFPWKKIFRGN